MLTGKAQGGGACCGVGRYSCSGSASGWHRGGTHFTARMNEASRSVCGPHEVAGTFMSEYSEADY